MFNPLGSWEGKFDDGKQKNGDCSSGKSVVVKWFSLVSGVQRHNSYGIARNLILPERWVLTPVVGGWWHQRYPCFVATSYIPYKGSQSGQAELGTPPIYHTVANAGHNCSVTAQPLRTTVCSWCSTNIHCEGITELHRVLQQNKRLFVASPAPLERILIATWCRSFARTRKVGESTWGEGPRTVPRMTPAGFHWTSASIWMGVAFAQPSAESSNSQETVHIDTFNNRQIQRQ